MELVVGMGDYVVTDAADAVIKTYALASCVAVTVYSPLKKAAGMIHVVLPAPMQAKDAWKRPAYYAVTGIPLLIDTMCRKYGCSKSELQVQIYGGAESMISLDIYDIGKRNINTVKRSLYELGLTIYKSELRGNESRSISMEAKSGQVEIYRRPIIRYAT